MSQPIYNYIFSLHIKDTTITTTTAAATAAAAAASIATVDFCLTGQFSRSYSRLFQVW